MGRATCYIAASKAAYAGLRNRGGENWKGLHALVDWDNLFEHLNSNVEGGIEFLEDLQEAHSELDDSDGSWYTRGKGLLVMDIKGDDDTWMLMWPKVEDKVEWFRPFYKAFREDVDHYVNHNLDEKAFAAYETLSPPWRLEKSYERQFSGRVAILDEYGRIMEIDYPMEFLRLLEPGEEWALSKVGWLYK